MTSNINRQALVTFVELLEAAPQSFTSYERAVELLSSVGFSCQLACRSEEWRQIVTFLAPPSTLLPVEAKVETPFGTQQLVLEPSMSLPQHVNQAFSNLGHLVDALRHAEGPEVSSLRNKIAESAHALQSQLAELGRLERAGVFPWPLERFELAISNGAREERVAVRGPLMAALGHGFLSDESRPGVAVCDLASAMVKLLMDRTIERGRSAGAGFLAREEGMKFAELLREHLALTS
jgi:hypothetical protein